MPIVHCCLIFRKYTEEQKSQFLQECEERNFEFLTNFKVGKSVHYSTSTDEFNERDETEFSFDLKPLAELGLDSKDKYEGIVLAEADLVTTFEALQRTFKNNGLADDAALFK
uniref:Uncharacterized protein n=1 Tax=Panagrolaimus superbus TaxID=310955 RepID=A0A914XQE9_9BILA